MIISNDLPDMIWYDVRTNYPGGATAMMNDGVIIPLDDFIDAIPNYSAYLNSHEDVNKMVRNDDSVLFGIDAILTRTNSGETYQSLNNRRIEYECWSGLAINEDWLDDLEIEVPVTIDDWTAMLMEFKTEKGAVAPFTTSAGWLFTTSSAFVSAYNTCPLPL